MITTFPAPGPPSAALAGKFRVIPFSGTYFRAVNARFSSTALSFAHTPTVRSRFSDGTGGYNTLYLAEDHLTALFEVQALLGSPWSPGSLIPSPHASWLMVPVTFSLKKVVDLTDPATQTALETSFQELTGDWQGYTFRTLFAPKVFAPPSSTPPTQFLGAFLASQGFDGMLTVSAKVPYRRNLIILPDKLTGPDATGGSYSYHDPFEGDLKEYPPSTP